MSYVKTQWVNNTTPINDTNLNKIEQGIYDNSLVVDAVTNILNPTDTETYKTSELTEGQITDVIGVNDIVIKGQTLQEGEPTPSSPVDVNVVSGSNVINTSNKNLFNKDTKDFSKGYYLNNNGVEQPGGNWGVYYIRVEPNEAYSISGCQTNGGASFCWFDKNKAFISYIGQKQNRSNMIAPNNAYYLGLSIVWNTTSSAYDNNIMLEQSSTATTYEPHQGKELPLDLPVENLFDKDNANIIEGFINGQTKEITSYNITKSAYISVLPNTTYTISKTKGLRFIIGTTPSVAIGTICTSIKSGNDNSTTKLTITSGANDKYLIIFYYKSDVDTLSEQYIINSIQIEQGSKANAYTPYGTDPIELCKIGNYQDYFYKSGSKWYLHKEIGKVVLDGTQTIKYVDTSSTNTSRVHFENIINAKSNNIDVYANQLSGKFIWDTDEAGIYVNSTIVAFRMSKSIIGTTIEEVNTYLSNNNIILYYLLNTATNTEITDTTLISQLEAIYNAPLYEQTNITQTNNDLPMVLDITACKDNINGIKAFIRK